MRTIIEILAAIAFGVFAAGIEYDLHFKALKKLHDAVRLEALTKVAQGLTPMSEIVRRVHGREPEDSWLKPVPPEELGSAMRGVTPMIPPKH